ncbi:MAG: STT3 domain-containing protein [Promethearchaeota archaeon]
MPSLSVKIKRFFQEGIERSRSSMKISAANIIVAIALLLVFTCAVFIRLAPIFNNVHLIKAFDPWVQYKCTTYIVDNGLWDFLNWVDYQSWYPEGNKLYNMYIGLPLTNAIFYWILSGLGFPVTVYDVCFISPAFMGGVTCIVTYFLGKELLDKKAGLLSAFFMAFSPGYMQRTVAGFYDNETLGVFGTLLCLLFFVRALKRGSVVDGFFGGLSFGYLSLSWGGYTYTALLIPLFTLTLIIFKKYSKRLLLAYTSMMGTGLIIHSFFRRVSIATFFNSSSLLIPLAMLALLPFVEYLYRKKEYNPTFYRNFWKFIKKALIPGLLVAGVVIWVFGDVLLMLPQRFMTILNPLFRNEVALVASVGEHSPASWSVFYYNTLVPLIFVVPGIYFAYKRGKESDIVLIIFTITLYYFTGSMIRIILLFAPAAALMGSYGISQIMTSYGNIAKKRPSFARRRRRDTRPMLDRSAVVVLFVFLGGLGFVQVQHASDIAYKQMPWSELVSGGQFHDWENAFTWMQTNLDSGTVVVSWWDYGYWSTILGNVTTVNDNATLNQTRIGLTGMAMMLQDEIESGRALKGLHADYVLVYFGHMVSGLGGDEGKWPWMVKICNDNSLSYASLSYLDSSKWFEPGEQVFNYSTFINEQNGLYKENWFNSQLVRMMFYDEPLEPTQATTQLAYYTAQEISGGDGKEPRKTDIPNPSSPTGEPYTWKEMFSQPGYFDFKVFRKAYFSPNTLVKIFQVDYTAIESDFNITDFNVYDNGYGNVVVENTGERPLNITKMRQLLSGQPTTTFHNTSSFEGLLDVQPGETKSFWFNTERTNLVAGNNYDIGVTAEAQAIDKVYSFEKTLNGVVKNSTDLSVFINRTESTGVLPDKVKVVVGNDGTEALHVDDIIVDDVAYGNESVVALNDTYVVPVNESRSFEVSINPALYTSSVIGDTFNLNVTVVEGVSDATSVAFSSLESRLVVEGDYVTLKESDLIYNDEYLRNYSLVDFDAEEMSRVRSYIQVDTDSNVAYTNGTIKISVKNEGNTRIGLDELKLNGTTISSWTLSGGGYFMDPGESRQISLNASPLKLDAVQDLTILAINSTGDVVAADGGRIKTIAPNEAIMILSNNSRTLALTNETFDVTVKNVGNVETTLTRLVVNGTSINLDDDMVILGTNNRTIGIQEACTIRYNLSSTLHNFTGTSQASLTVDTASVSDSVVINATINPIVALNITLEEAVTAASQRINVLATNNGTVDKYINLTISSCEISLNDGAFTTVFVPEMGDYQINVTDSRDLGYGGYSHFNWGDLPGAPPVLVEGDKLTIIVYTVEGGEDTLVTHVGA